MNRVVADFGSSLKKLLGDLRAEICSLPWAPWVALGILCVGGAALRIKYLFIPMRYDEAQTYTIYASRKVTDFLRDYSEPNNHIFHTLLVHASTRLFGSSEWAIRLPALVAGILLIPVTAFVFRKLFNTTVGLISAALVAGSSILIEYSINARGYMMQVLFFVMLLALARYLKWHASLAGWVIFVVLSALGFYTIPTMLYPFGVVMGWLLLMAIFEPGGQDARTLTIRLIVAGFATIALTLVFYSPVIIFHGFRPLISNPWVEPLTWSGFLQGWPLSLQRIWMQWNRGLPIELRVALSAGVLLYFAFYRGENRRQIILLMAALLWLPLAVCLQRVIPFSRVWMFLVPLYLALAAGGYAAVAGLILPSISGRRGWCTIVGPVVVLLIAGLFVVRSRSVEISGEAFPSAREIASYFDENLRDGDQIVGMFPGDLPILYYDQQPPKIRHSMFDLWGKSRRLLIVVRPSDQTPADVFRHWHIKAAEVDSPRLIRTFPGAAIYEAWYRVS